MAVHENVHSLTILANADLSTNQYSFVSRNSTNRIALTGAGLSADGVLYDKPSVAGRAAQVAISGVAKVLLGGTVAAGDEVTSDATGRAVVATTGDVILGVCTIGGAVTEIGSVQLAIQNRALFA